MEKEKKEEAEAVAREAEEKANQEKQERLAADECVKNDALRKQAIATQSAPAAETIVGYQVTLPQTEFMKRYQIAPSDCKEGTMSSPHFSVPILECSIKDSACNEAASVEFYKQKAYKFYLKIPKEENVWLKTMAKQLEAKAGKKGKITTMATTDRYCAYEVDFLNGKLVAMARDGFFFIAVADRVANNYGGRAPEECHEGIFDHDKAGSLHYKVESIGKEMHDDYWKERKVQESKEKTSDFKI